MKLTPWFLGVALLLLVLNGTLIVLARSEREGALQNAANVAQMAVAQSAEHTDGVFDRVYQTLSGIAEVLRIQPSILEPTNPYLHRLLGRLYVESPVLRSLFVISSEGKILHLSALAATGPVDVSDRDYVRHHLDRGSDSLFIGKPIQSRITGKWIVPVSRRVGDADGRLIAIVAAALDPEVFVATLKKIPLPTGMRAAMVAPGSDLLGCMPQAECLGQSAASWPVFTNVAGNAARRGLAVSTREDAFVPGPPGPGAFEVSSGYGVTVAMTADKYDVTAAWQNRMPILLALGMAGSTGIVSVALVLYCQIGRRNQAMADLARANSSLELRVAKRTAELQQSEERLRAFIATARDAIVIIDRHGMILAFNPAATDLFGYWADEVIGMNANMLVPVRHSVDYDAPVHGIDPDAVDFKQEMVALHKDGTEIAVEVSVGLSESNGEHIRVGVLRDIRARKIHEEALWRLANVDGLTGVLNRRAFLEQGASIVAAAQRYDQPLAALMVDADHFKRINDSQGHHVGDEVLRILAGVLRNVTRGCDLVGRLGGEEFAILLPETDADGARELAERLLEAVRAEPVPVPRGKISFTISIGLASFLGEGTLADLLRDADHALYEAKSMGRNRLVLSHVLPEVAA